MAVNIDDIDDCENRRVELSSEIKGLLKHVLGMNALDLMIYSELCNFGCATVEDLADTIGKDKSTIYKSLKNLVENGFVKREVRILRKGGYKYIFSPTPPKNLEKIIKKKMDVCFKQLIEFIETSIVLSS